MLVGLFCVLVGLFCVLVGLFCVLVGLFCVLVGLFCVYTFSSGALSPGSNFAKTAPRFSVLAGGGRKGEREGWGREGGGSLSENSVP